MYVYILVCPILFVLSYMSEKSNVVAILTQMLLIITFNTIHACTVCI